MKNPKFFFLLQTILINSIVLLICITLSCHYSPDKASASIIADTIVNRYAKGFRIISTNNGYIAEVINPWQEAKNITLQYILSRNKNTTGTNSSQIIIPVRKIVCLSSTHIAFVDALNECTSICGISGIHNIYNADIIKRWKQDSLFEAGFENNLNYEKIITAQPDVVFAYGIGAEINGYVVKLKELNIPVVIIGEYLEQHPLARTEWLKFFAIFFDKLTFAEKIFSRTDSLYQYWKTKNSRYTFRPKVMTALPWNGNWYISGGNTYIAQLITDAGGQYLWNDLNNVSTPMNIETVFQRCRNADYWLNIGQAINKTDIINNDKRLTLFRPFQNGNMYNNIARIRPQGGNDYWESAIVLPHVILADITKILHPAEYPNETLYFYRKLD